MPIETPEPYSTDSVRQGLAPCLARLWRYAWVLSRERHVADDLVQATCVRALERAGHYRPGTRLDRWLFSILHSIWLNEVRSQRVRHGQGFVDSDSLVAEGLGVENQILASQVMRQVQALPEAQRETVFLTYVEGLSYRETAEIQQIPIGTVMSRWSPRPNRCRARGRGGACWPGLRPAWSPAYWVIALGAAGNPPTGWPTATGVARWPSTWRSIPSRRSKASTPAPRPRHRSWRGSASSWGSPGAIPWLICATSRRAWRWHSRPCVPTERLETGFFQCNTT